MKRLTINRLAGAGMKADRRGYRSLAIGIFLSIFMITALFMSAQGIVLSRQAVSALRMGYADCFLLNDHPTDEKIRSYGLFDRIGHIYVSGHVTGSEKYLGWYDEEGALLMNRQLIEGRMPEQPGEIAMERSAIEGLRLERAPSVGDTVTLSVTPIDGTEETREFTLVGLLTEQSRYMDPTRNITVAEGTVAIPSILTCADEPPFETGRAVTHRALTLNKGVTFLQLSRAEQERLIRQEDFWDIFYLGMERGEVYYSMSNSMHIDEEGLRTISLGAVLGVALVLATCVGISGAMDGQLARRREQIGLLRCVGATRRQIRRVFGREAWLLALILSPLAVAAGCAFAWMLSLIAPQQFVFGINLWLLIPILILSIICILLASGLPLRRAAQVMPMGVLRDTELLRKSRRLKSKKAFHVPRLIALRQLQLHPTRQLGSALLVALMLFVVALGVSVSLYAARDMLADSPDFEMHLTGGYFTSAYGDDLSIRGLTAQDMAQIRALDGVARADTYTESNVNIVMDSVGAAFRRHSRLDHLMTEEEYRQNVYEHMTGSNYSGDLPAGFSPELVNIDPWLHNVDEHRAIRELMGADEEQIVLNMPVMVAPLERLDLSSCVVDGDVDIRAINEGREVLVYAPDSYYVRYRLYDRDTYYTNYLNEREEELLSMTENNDFEAGQVLRFEQFTCGDMNALTSHSYDVEGFHSYYEQFDRQAGQVTAGAVLKGNLTAIDSLLRIYGGPGCLLTTEQGARALGLTLNRRGSSYIYMEEGVSEEVIDQAAEAIEEIMLRTENMTLHNKLETIRESREGDRQMMIVLFSIGALFFAVAVSMITGSVTRHIRADSRMIGMLRAVGADEKALTGCYSAQVTINVALGAALTAVAALLAQNLHIFRMPDGTLLPAFAVAAALALLCLLCCHLILRLRIKELIRRSIVDTIKEL